jgi:DNA (cytosine-5)-methyltransferase 1
VDVGVNVGSLFTGIGGFDLGLERAGMRIAWQCEIDPFCRQVLTKHWPDVPRYHDITTLRGTDVEPVEVLAGGFPCQDLSQMGGGAGIAGARSGLWAEYARLVGELRPRYVIVENVNALLRRGLDRVLADLAALGYDAEWDCLPASAFGAHQRRDRVWLIAYPAADVADAEGEPVRAGLREDQPPAVGGGRFGDGSCEVGIWPAEPSVGRVAHGVPGRMDRLGGLGNALVPAIAEWIGRRIMSFEAPCVYCGGATGDQFDEHEACVELSMEEAV